MELVIEQVLNIFQGKVKNVIRKNANAKNKNAPLLISRGGFELNQFEFKYMFWSNELNLN